MKLKKATLINTINLETLGGATDLLTAKEGNDTHLFWFRTKGIFKSDLYKSFYRGQSRKHIFKLIAKFLAALFPGKFRMFPYLDNEDKNLFSVQKMDMHGKLIWQYGNNNKIDVYCSHQGGNMIAVYDIDGDGANEIIALYSQNKLGIFSSVGKLIKSVQLPFDNFSYIKIGKTGGNKKDITICVGVSEAAYLPYSYGNPLILLNLKLEIIKTITLNGGMGHSIQVINNGTNKFDSFLAGYTLIDNNGKVQWVVDGFEKEENINTKRMHSDWVEIVYLEQGGWNAVIAGSDTLYFINDKGKILWDKKGVHPQHVVVGKFNLNDQRDYIFLFHQRYSMELYDFEGNLHWQGILPGNWPKGRPVKVKDDYCFHMQKPALTWKNPLNNGNDLIVYNEAGWPYAIDGFGNKMVEFPFPKYAKQIDLDIPSRHRPDDYGYGYKCEVRDNDGMEEVIIYDRNYAWIYKMEL